MTTNGLLTYFGAVLFFIGIAFFVLGRVRSQPREEIWEYHKVEKVSGTLKHSRDRTRAQRADLLCGAILCALALIAELASLARGGPSAGERSGNLAGALLLIALLTLFCVGVCLMVRKALQRLLDRND